MTDNNGPAEIDGKMHLMKRGSTLSAEFYPHPDADAYWKSLSREQLKMEQAAKNSYDKDTKEAYARLGSPPGAAIGLYVSPSEETTKLRQKI